MRMPLAVTMFSVMAGQVVQFLAAMVSVAFRALRSAGWKGYSISVILQESVSLDGLAAGPADSVDFVPAATADDHSFGERQLGFIDSIDVILLGRVTYSMFAKYWPKVTEGEDKPFADRGTVLLAYAAAKARSAANPR